MNLFIVATPIGNLGDVSFRALEILKEVDAILCEDTRVTNKLLMRFEIKKPLISYHAHSAEIKVNEIIKLLESKNLALVSDAGTPGINDPGGKLIEIILERLGDKVKIVPIPGPSTVVTALSISGFPVDRFLYMGFPPHKKGREKFFREVAAVEETIIFLESPYRILKALKSLEEFAPDRLLMVCRELTKMHETVYRGTVKEVTEKLKNDMIKGEFVVVVRRKFAGDFLL